MNNRVPITAENFVDYQTKMVNIILGMKFEDLDPNYKMTLEGGIAMGNHAFECDACNVLHYLVSLIIDTHRLQIDR